MASTSAVSMVTKLGVRASHVRLLERTLDKTITAANFVPQRNSNTGHWNKPKISGRYQAVIRKTAVLAGISQDRHEKELGLPPVKDKKILRSKLPKLHKDQRTKDDRQARISENLERMDVMVEQWRKAKEQEKAKARPDVPF
ncbi:hypothetical protein RI367_007231 [Sorochytrium milnesiophthora]